MVLKRGEVWQLGKTNQANEFLLLKIGHIGNVKTCKEALVREAVPKKKNLWGGSQGGE